MNEHRPELELTIGPAAHGGHCVARHEGRVVFVRHALPGEVVRVRLTEYDDGARFWRGDVTEVLQASEHRVNHPWPLADSLLAGMRGGRPVGGAEFGHIALDAQRELKAGIFREQLKRLAGADREIWVEPVPDEAPDGLRWRTRVGFSVNAGGHLAMHAHRSDELIAVADMPLAVDAVNRLSLWTVDFSGMQRVEVAAGSEREPLVLLVPNAVPERKGAGLKETGRTGSGGKQATSKRAAAVARNIAGASVALWDPEAGNLEQLRGRTWLTETIPGHSYRITGDGFWQIHRSAPAVLVAALLDGLTLQPGERVADLYAGAGLFSAPLAQAVGPKGTVLSIESAAGASRDARRNLHGYPQVEILQGKVDKVLREQKPALDVVVLDPPRAGAGSRTVEHIVAAAPRAVGYISCDPASFARDLGYFRGHGWELESLRVFDLYPHTHHMESFAILRPLGS